MSIHQPCFLPWLGYFNKIHYSDIFIIHDDVQYSKNSYFKRTLIKKNNFENIIEVIEKPMDEVELNEKVDVIISEWMGVAFASPPEANKKQLGRGSLSRRRAYTEL